MGARCFVSHARPLGVGTSETQGAHLRDYSVSSSKAIAYEGVRTLDFTCVEVDASGDLCP